MYGIAHLPSHLAKSIECGRYTCSIALSIAFSKFMFRGVEIPTATSVHMEVASMKAENVGPNGYKYE